MISTPVNTFNYFSKLLELKDEEGNPIFLSYSVDLSCKRCRAGKHPEQCRHMIHMLPRWKSEDKMKLAEIIMQDEMTTLLRESRGLIIDDESNYFLAEDIEDLFASVTWTPPVYENPRWMLVVLDPNTRSGKGSSNMALLAMTLDHGLFTVSMKKQRRSDNIFNTDVHDILAPTIAYPFKNLSALIIQIA